MDRDQSDVIDVCMSKVIYRQYDDDDDDDDDDMQ